MVTEFESYNPEHRFEAVEPKTELEKRSANAEMVVNDFLGVKEGEKVLFITDNNPLNTDRELIGMLGTKLAEKGALISEIVASRETNREELLEAVRQHDLIWDSWDMEDTDVEFDEVVEIIKSRQSRMAWCPGVRAESLDNDGALAEKLEVLNQRLGRMEEQLRDAVGLHVKSTYGTDLWIKLRKGERRWFKDNGVPQPGDWDNLPGGEIFTTPDEGGVNGILVLPALQDEVTRDQGVDEFVRLTIRNGKLAKIDGGESAEKLRVYLEEHARTEETPENALQFAEVAFGANAKARSVVSSPAGHYTDLTHPTTETEKRLGTMHMAIGSTKHGAEGTEGHTDSNVHLDFVVPRLGLTVETFDLEEDFGAKKNSRRLIDEGRWKFLD